MPLENEETIDDLAATTRDLLATVEQEIIPRLMLRHRNFVSETPCVDEPMQPSEGDVGKLAELVIDPELTAGLAFLEQKLVQGLTLETVLLELVAPAARLLGQQWEDDERSFTEVTLGVGTLQRLMHAMAPSFTVAESERGVVVLTTPAGEQHTFGIFVLAEFLRRAGWGTVVEPGLSTDRLCDLVREHRIAAVCVSVSNVTLVDTLPAIADAVTAASQEKVHFLVGGGLDLSRFVGETLVPVQDPDPRSLVEWLDSNVEL